MPVFTIVQVAIKALVFTIVQVSDIVPVANKVPVSTIVPVFPAGTYGHYRGSTRVHTHIRSLGHFLMQNNCRAVHGSALFSRVFLPIRPGT